VEAKVPLQPLHRGLVVDLLNGSITGRSCCHRCLMCYTTVMAAAVKAADAHTMPSSLDEIRWTTLARCLSCRCSASTSAALLSDHLQLCRNPPTRNVANHGTYCTTWLQTCAPCVLLSLINAYARLFWHAWAGRIFTRSSPLAVTACA
jgi:hypothetical protein